MAELRNGPAGKAKRVFEQPPDAISLYSDMAQVLATRHEVLLQFYETIPKQPDANGEITEVTSRLRVTVVLSPAHAANVAKTLMEAQAKAPDPGGSSNE